MENANVIKLLENKDKDIHIMGLCSDGNIHAGVDDFVNMYKFLVNNGFSKIHFHLITEGRGCYLCYKCKCRSNPKDGSRNPDAGN